MVQDEAGFVDPKRFGINIPQLTNEQLVARARAINGIKEVLTKDQIKNKIAELNKQLSHGK